MPKADGHFPAYLFAIVQAGVIIVTGDHHDIWDLVSLRDNGHKLLADINGAAKYAERLRDMARDVKGRKRKALRDFAAGKTKVIPLLIPPGWLVRKGDPSNPQYKEVTERVRIVRKIYDLCLEGMTCGQIAKWLNARRQRYPLFAAYVKKGNRAEWTVGRVALISKDERVRGIYTAKIGGGGSYRKSDVDVQVRIFPQIISESIWRRTREALAGRKVLRDGPTGERIANLFVGKVFCACGQRLMLRSRGGPAGKYGFSFECSASRESGTCDNKMVYPIAYYEFHILTALCRLSSLAPRKQDRTGKAMAEQLALLQSQIAVKSKNARELENKPAAASIHP